MIKELVDWAKKAEVHPLIKSCVFHYEFEFIHPFARERQEEYYKVLGECDHGADSGKFVEFLLTTVYDALCEIADTEQVTAQVTEQVQKLLSVIDDKEYSTKEMMELLGLKHRPSFRDNYLLPALELGYIEMTIPDKPNSSKQRYRKVKHAIK